VWGRCTAPPLQPAVQSPDLLAHAHLAPGARRSARQGARTARACSPADTRVRAPPGAVRGGHDAILEMLNLHDRSMERLGTGAEAGNASAAGAGAARASAAGPPPGRPRPAAGEPDEL